ncbi:MAG: Na/Pi symporter, partial [Burkholderiaceae bacterium]
MTFTLLLLHLAGAATLLIWAVRMVRTGVERGHAGLLRRVVQQAERGRIRSACAGIGTAILLQGSTAVCLLSTSFAQVGSISVATALAVVLGADLGSALVVFFLSFDLSWLMPLLLLLGGWLFLRGTSRPVIQAGRILLGIALILLSLRLISEATQPVHDSAILATMIGYLNADVITALLLGAGITWLMHSGVAAMLFFVTLASEGLLPLGAGLGLILGGNIGSGLIAAGLTRHVPNEARGIALGNLGFRTLAAIGAAAALYWIELPAIQEPENVALWLVSLHLAFNFTLMIIALPFTQHMASLLRKLLPAKPDETGGRRTYSTSALDASVISDPVPA